MAVLYIPGLHAKQAEAPATRKTTKDAQEHTVTPKMSLHLTLQEADEICNQTI
jgi:hypothetical protein